MAPTMTPIFVGIMVVRAVYAATCNMATAPSHVRLREAVLAVLVQLAIAITELGGWFIVHEMMGDALLTLVS